MWSKHKYHIWKEGGCRGPEKKIVSLCKIFVFWHPLGDSYRYIDTTEDEDGHYSLVVILEDGYDKDKLKAIADAYATLWHEKCQFHHDSWHMVLRNHDVTLAPDTVAYDSKTFL